MITSSGRPRKLDDTSRRVILRRVQAGATLASASRSVGCSDRTVRREALRDPLFGWRLDLACQTRDTVSERLKALDAEIAIEPSPAIAGLFARLAAEVRALWGDRIGTSCVAGACAPK